MRWIHSWLVGALLLSAGLSLGAAPETQAALIRALGDSNPSVRERAAADLGRLRPPSPEAIAALVAALGNGDLYLRGVAAVALGQLGKPAVPALALALQGPNAELRYSAAIALGRCGSAARSAQTELRKALMDASAQVRGAAAVALSGLGPEARLAVPGLTDLLHDQDQDVRRAAAQALRQIAPEARAIQLQPEALQASLDALLPTLMQEHQVPGVSIALIRDRKVVWTQAYGVLNVQTREPLRPDTVFEAASMSKLIFTLLAMRLVEAKRLDLDRPLVAYGAELQVPDQPWRKQVTARMVLSHTAGFPNWRPGGEEREGPLPLLFEPGTRFGYSGEGIFYLQRQVERITGLPLDRLAERALFRPLGLRLTGFAWTPELGAQQASGHREDGAVLSVSKYVHPNAAYTLYTTAGEYARLLVEVLVAEQGGSAVLSQKGVREMLRHQVSVGGREPVERPGAAQGLAVHWGLGWSINETPQGDIAHHSGANQTGFRCFSQFSPSRGTGIVILTNGLGGGDLWTRVIAAFGDY